MKNHENDSKLIAEEVVDAINARKINEILIFGIGSSIIYILIAIIL